MKFTVELLYLQLALLWEEGHVSRLESALYSVSIVQIAFIKLLK